MTEDNTDQQHDETSESEGIKQLRARAEKVPGLEQKVADYERREAFRDAGIDLNDSRNKYFVKGYDGDLTPDAIKAKAVEDGFLEDSEQVEKTGELEAHQRADRATSGEAPAPTDISAELSQAKDQNEVMQILAKHNPELIVQQ